MDILQYTTIKYSVNSIHRINNHPKIKQTKMLKQALDLNFY